MRRTLLFAALVSALGFSGTGLANAHPYAIVVREMTIDEYPEWKAVVDALQQKHNGEIVTYSTSVGEVVDQLRQIAPTHIAFVVRPEEASSTYVVKVSRLTRQLDDDPYGDAIWGIVTGYTPEDALRIVSIDGFRVRNVLAGTGAGWLPYVKQGITTSEADYGRMWVKESGSEIVEISGPTDRTEFLVEKLNTNTFDIFITSGHANVDNWQLHYPDPGLEGFFRSWEGQVYGDPYEGPDVPVNSTNPKIYFGLGNCYIGRIADMNSMVLAWIHSGGAYLFTGYVTLEGEHSYQLGGIPAYFFVQSHYTWPEAFFANNQALLFDRENGIAEIFSFDKDGGALYGDPALDVRVDPVRDPLYETQITVSPGTERDTVTVKIRMNEEGTPGFNGKWGNRHPVILFDFRAEDPQIEYTDAYEAVVTENFALMYVWKQGDPLLGEGEEREVVFTATGPIVTAVEEQHFVDTVSPSTFVLLQNYPNPFNSQTVISYRLSDETHVILRVYDVNGRLVRTLVDGEQSPGYHTLAWNAKDESGVEVASGVYLYRLRAGGLSSTRRMVLLR
ncbi:MAG TPA: T9SS type A sorting domain-containing protein [Candidatus Latescibacteria bacterium]|nr:T9SS type A sorting domain-containing protein [Candidatus Latescibacterota bacterium]